MKLGFRIAKRFLKSNLGQTILIIIGIGIGVSVQIFIGSLIQGLQKSLIEKTIGDSSQITITSQNEDKKISDYKKIIDKITGSTDEVKYITAVNDNPALLVTDKSSQSIIVRGFDIKEADKIYNIRSRIVEGKEPTQEYEVILGIDLKDEYGININDQIIINTTSQKIVNCKVVGFFDLQVAGINNGWVITTRETADNIFVSKGTVTSIEMQVIDEESFNVDIIGDDIKGILVDDSLKISNWKTENEQLLSGLQGQSVSSIMIQIFVLISVVLGIASVLAITVLQKSKQIGILKAMGMSKINTGLVFLFEGLILGIFGALLGIITGLGLGAMFTKFALNPDGTPVVNLYIDPFFIILSGVVAVLASVMASLIPAIKSSKLNPIEIIRNN